MNVLQVVATLPSPEMPQEQPFTAAQIESLKRAGLNITVFNIKGYESKLNYFTAPKRIKELVEKHDIELIHAHYSYSGLSAWLAKTGKPIVLSLMGSDLLGTADHDGKVTFRGKLDIKLSRFLAKNVDQIIVKSKEMRNHLDFIPNVEVIPNGVNFDFFKPVDTIEMRKKLDIDPELFVALFLGNSKNERKNFKLAKAAVDKLKTLEGYENTVLLNPWGISHAQVVEYMNAANVLLLTSYWEGSPNVVKEAMACNLPIISVNVGDIEKLLKNTKNCFIVPFDENEIVEKMKILFKTRERSNGRDNIQYLRDDVIAQRIIKIYERLLSKN